MKRTECGILFSYGTTTLFYDGISACDFHTSNQGWDLNFAIVDYDFLGAIRGYWTENPEIGSGVKTKLAAGGYGFIGEFGYYEFHSFEGQRWVIYVEETSNPDIYKVFITDKQWTRLKEMLTLPTNMVCV